MNEFFQERLNVAHALIDAWKCDEAVEVLRNLDMRIHDTAITTNINATATDIEKQYNASFISICNKAGDPYEGFKNTMNLKKWRAQQYLRFYDNLLIKHEL